MTRPTVDFDALRERLAEARVRAEQGARAVLERRARALARPVANRSATATADAALELLVLRRADAAFGLPLDHVLDVVRAGAFTALPGAVLPVSGLLPWRGRLLTVIDLARTDARPARVVVVQSDASVIGVAADAVDDIRTVVAADIHVMSDGRSIVRGDAADALSLLDPALLARRIAAAG